VQKYSFEIKEEDIGERIDHFLVKALPEKEKFSRTFVKKLINEGNVFLNGKVTIPHHLLKLEDVITAQVPDFINKTQPKAQKINLNIIYEDEDIIVVNKPVGMVVHPGAGVRDQTLVNALVYHCKTLSSAGGESRPGIVHRLDKGTSGLLIAAKNDFAHRELARQFKQRKVKRKYIAFVKGKVELDNGRVELPIGRHPRNPKKMAVAFSKSKAAATNYKVLKRFGDYTMLEISPDTGRTHQIRVHMSYIDYPLLGDTQYGGPDEKIGRPALHAGKISFYHPRTHKLMEFEIPLPQDMKDLMVLKEEVKR